MRDILPVPDAQPHISCVLYTYRLEQRQISVVKSIFRPEADNRKRVLRLIPDLRRSNLFRLALDFVFPEPFDSAFSRLVDACHTEGIAAIESLDQGLETRTGISVIRTALLLEVLIAVAIQTSNFPLLTALAAKGAPVSRPQTPALWEFREDAAAPLATESLALVAALVRGGWLPPKQPYASWVMTGVYGSRAGYDVGAANALFDALLAVGFLPDPPNLLGEPGAENWHFWWLGVKQAPVATLRHVARTMPVLGSVSVRRSHGLVAEAAAVPRRADVLAFLVREQGLDVDDMSNMFVESQQAGQILPPGSLERDLNYSQTALHAAAAQEDCVENMRWLLEDGGAKILRDGAGRTPFERAVLYDRYAAVAFFARHFEEKKLPFSHVDS